MGLYFLYLLLGSFLLFNSNIIVFVSAYFAYFVLFYFTLFYEHLKACLLNIDRKGVYSIRRRCGAIGGSKERNHNLDISCEKKP